MCFLFFWPVVCRPVQLSAVPEHGVVWRDGELPPQAHMLKDPVCFECCSAVAATVRLLPSGTSFSCGPGHPHTFHQVHHSQCILLHLPTSSKPVFTGLQWGYEELYGSPVGVDRLPSHSLDHRWGWVTFVYIHEHFYLLFSWHLLSIQQTRMFCCDRCFSRKKKINQVL